jgi:TolA-binding protein
MEATSDDHKTNALRRIGSQPVALAAGALILVMLVAGSIGLWRAYTGNSPEQERMTSLRQMQTRATQASEQLFEKTKGLETSQQQTIDQLQTVQDQLQSLKRLVTAQQADAKRLSEQVGGLTGAIDTLRTIRSAGDPKEIGPFRTPRKEGASRRRASQTRKILNPKILNQRQAPVQRDFRPERPPDADRSGTSCRPAGRSGTFGNSTG